MGKMKDLLMELQETPIMVPCPDCHGYCTVEVSSLGLTALTVTLGTWTRGPRSVKRAAGTGSSSGCVTAVRL